VADKEPFQFITVNSGNDGNPWTISTREYGTADFHPFTEGHFDGEKSFNVHSYCFGHRRPLEDKYEG
jgi:hypothetical protein